jgi:hypothetical protein
MALLEKPFFRYDLQVEVPATEVRVLVDALEGEPLSLKTRLGWPSIKAQIELDQRITAEILADDPWPDFENDLRAISVYLAEPISGREVYVAPGGEEPMLEGWLVVARRGDSARVPLALEWDEDQNMLVDRGVDRAALEPRWEELPDWVKRAIGPGLRAAADSAAADAEG